MVPGAFFSLRKRETMLDMDVNIKLIAEKTHVRYFIYVFEMDMD